MDYLPQKALDYAHAHREDILRELVEFASIPSVSTDPLARPALQQAAEWVADRLKRIGIDHVKIMPTGGHPLVYGEWLKAGTEAPTVLVYGHFDVQPPEPLELWNTPPFQPTVVGENLYGRGASDMKGQVMVALSAIDALMRTGGLAVNLKFLIEGEEELGSPSLGRFIREHQDLLRCDFALNTDSGLVDPQTPTIVYGLRGLVYFELRIYGPAHDLHSGSFGGAVHNPAQVLCELVAGMHDENGRITLPGFYNDVQNMDEEERVELNRLPTGEEFFESYTGVPRLFGEDGYTSVERVGGRPTLEVNGLYSGFIGGGVKTVLPSYAMAKLSSRIVPHQTPETVRKQLLEYLELHAPGTVRCELDLLSASWPSITDRQMPGVVAMSEAFEAVWGTRPVYKREGGSIPVVAELQSTLGVESVVTGFGLPDDNLHAPNEKQHLPTFYRGIDVIIHFFRNLAEPARA